MLHFLDTVGLAEWPRHCGLYSTSSVVGSNKNNINRNQAVALICLCLRLTQSVFFTRGTQDGISNFQFEHIAATQDDLLCVVGTERRNDIVPFPSKVLSDSIDDSHRVLDSLIQIVILLAIYSVKVSPQNRVIKQYCTAPNNSKQNAKSWSEQLKAFVISFCVLLYLDFRASFT